MSCGSASTAGPGCRGRSSPGLDAQQFEHDQLDRLRGAFLGGWGTPEGGTTPFIEGVTFDVIEVRGEFPDRVIVALFHAMDRPGIQFGRQWGLYDELGNPVDHEYADIGLMEDVESAAAACRQPAAVSRTRPGWSGSSTNRWLPVRCYSRTAIPPRAACDLPWPLFHGRRR